MTRETETSSTKECNPIIAWLKRKAIMLTIFTSAVAGVLGVSVYWVDLDLPRPVFSGDFKDSVIEIQRDIVKTQNQIIEAEKRVDLKLAALEKFTQGTRSIILGQTWQRLDREITRLESIPPATRTQDQNLRLSNLRNQMREVTDQLKLLKSLRRQ